jgi:hypothetical protein
MLEYKQSRDVICDVAKNEAKYQLWFQTIGRAIFISESEAALLRRDFATRANATHATDLITNNEI